MHQALSVPISYMGILTMTISFCTIVSSLCSARLTHKLGTRNITTISVFLTAAALLGFSFSTHFWMLMIFAVPYGLGAGSIDAALNNFVALHYSSRHMSWLHCFWGVGTIISPFAMRYALSFSTWNLGFRIVSVIQFGIALILLATRSLWHVKVDQAEKGSAPVSLKRALQIKGVPTLLIGFFAYCAAEATTMGWASTYLVQYKGITPESAAGLASLFFIGMTVGRFLSGFIMNQLGDRRMILSGTGILLLGILLLNQPDTPSIVSYIGFVTIGFGCAPIYPCIIHATPQNFGAKNSSAIIGIQMASAYVGSTFIPPVFGVLGSHLGFWIMPFFLFLFTALMLVMVETTFRLCSQVQDVTSSQN